MMNILPFEYKAQRYKALVAIKKHMGHHEYRITIMNGELEKLLFGHHIIIERAGRFIAGQHAKDDEVQQLQNAVVQALKDHYGLAVNRQQNVCSN